MNRDIPDRETPILLMRKGGDSATLMADRGDSHVRDLAHNTKPTNENHRDRLDGSAGLVLGCSHFGLVSGSGRDITGSRARPVRLAAGREEGR
jgi:hypothetical protein